MQREPKKIYCPRCRHKVGQWDGKSQTPYEKMCKWCRKLIVFHPATGETEWYPVPERSCSSGERYW